eukprot:4134366-Heterocapsa_arctica.AAC.1
MTSASLSGGLTVNRCWGVSCTGVMAGIAVVALKSSADIGSPKYRILSVVLFLPGNEPVAEPK